MENAVEHSLWCNNSNKYNMLFPSLILIGKELWKGKIINDLLKSIWDGAKTGFNLLIWGQSCKTFYGRILRIFCNI